MLSDLEITKLCAEAMEFSQFQEREGTRLSSEEYRFEVGHSGFGWLLYDPLHDDAQAMALVKKFGLGITFYSENWWGVNDRTGFNRATDLNRAICECVAKMRVAQQLEGADRDG